jgi:hypothetical protein
VTDNYDKNCEAGRIVASYNGISIDSATMQSPDYNIEAPQVYMDTPKGSETLFSLKVRIIKHQTYQDYTKCSSNRNSSNPRRRPTR